MGVRYQKRKRLESLKKINDITLSAIGNNDLNLEKYDEQIIFDHVNEKLDKQEDKIVNRN